MGRPAGRGAWATTRVRSAVAEPRVITDDGSPAPSGLVDAVLAFESAVSSGDQEAIAHFFERGEHTVRVDGTGLIEGDDAIAAHRSVRPAAGERVVDSLLIHRAGPGVAHVVIANRPAAGG